MEPATCKVGKRGVVILPAALRRQYGLEEGTLLLAERRDDGILLRPAVALPVEYYPPERQAALLLSTAVDAADYQRACAVVRQMGLDPETILHLPPPEC